MKKILSFAILLILCTILLLEPTQLLADNDLASLQLDTYPPCIESSKQEEVSYSHINVTVIVPLLQRFSLLSLNNRLTTRILITVNRTQISLDSFNLEMPAATVIKCPQTIQQRIYRLDQKNIRMVFVIPSEMKNFVIELSGNTPIWTILYRSYTILLPFEISSTIPVAFTYLFRVLLLSQSTFLSGYPSFEGDPTQSIYTSMEKDRLGQIIFTVKGNFPPLKVAWGPKNWARNALLISGIVVSILILLFLTPGQLKRRVRLQKISAVLGKVVAVKNKIVEQIVIRSTTNNHAKIFLTLSLIMVTLPLAVGEDPRTNILVLTSIPVEIEIEQTAAKTSDMIKVYTVVDERNDLPTISRLHFFDAVIIGDYYWQAIPMVTPPFEVQAMEFIKTKIVLDQYKSSKLAQWVLETYAGVILVRSQEELGMEFIRLLAQNKALWEWDRYIRIIQIEAILSLLITILLVTTIIVYLIENNDTTLQTNFARTITITIFAFCFLQCVFFTVSRLLIPLSTHTGGSGITAISYLGPFGGGSMPRMACAIFGFIFAFASASKKFGKEISWKLFLALIVTGLTLIVNPVTGGQFLWNFLLDMVGGVVGSEKSLISHTLGSLEDHIAFALGSDILGFYRSRGIMLFFAGVVPLLVLGRARKYTTTALLFVCSILTGWGAMRIGQMLAYHFFASIIPGIFLGLIFSIPFLVLSIAEEKIGEHFHLEVF